MKISLVGDYDTVVGFKLAGVKDSHAVDDPKAALQKLKELMKDKETGIIIISEKFADKIREELKKLTEGRVIPVIVEIPDKKGPVQKKKDPIKELIRRAVGIEVKFGGL